MSISSKSLPELGVAPHDHPPRWLFLFATLIAACFIDIAIKRFPVWLVSSLAATTWAILVYSFSSSFFEPQFQYSAYDAMIGILSALIGGLVVGGGVAIFDSLPLKRVVGA